LADEHEGRFGSAAIDAEIHELQSST